MSQGARGERAHWANPVYIYSLGYAAGICERKTFLRALYEKLSEDDKARIHVGKKVVGIDHAAEGVTVRCADGSAYVADVVVGADGIHSRTRAEMQRVNRYYLTHQLLPHSLAALRGNGMHALFGDELGETPFLMRHSPVLFLLTLVGMLAWPQIRKRSREEIDPGKALPFLLGWIGVLWLVFIKRWSVL